MRSSSERRKILANRRSCGRLPWKRFARSMADWIGKAREHIYRTATDLEDKRSTSISPIGDLGKPQPKRGRNSGDGFLIEPPFQPRCGSSRRGPTRNSKCVAEVSTQNALPQGSTPDMLKNFNTGHNTTISGRKLVFIRLGGSIAARSGSSLDRESSDQKPWAVATIGPGRALVLSRFD